jgi:hypothetical protein
MDTKGGRVTLTRRDGVTAFGKATIKPPSKTSRENGVNMTAPATRPIKPRLPRST